MKKKIKYIPNSKTELIPQTIILFIMTIQRASISIIRLHIKFLIWYSKPYQPSSMYDNYNYITGFNVITENIFY